MLPRFPTRLHFGVINDGQARIIHLTFAFLLAFPATFPALAPRRDNRIPVTDWILAALGPSAALYLLVFYQQISLRPGLPTWTDVTMSHHWRAPAAARPQGVPSDRSARHHRRGLMLGYIFAGPWLPGMMGHKGASLARVASQMVLTSEGIFGVALGVSTNVVFFFVLFGSLLEKAGAGNYFIQMAFAMLGTFRGGPAKAGVVASGMTGMISGSSIANTVMTGTFTIPLMKRVGYSAVKAGAIEAAAGINGQLMPPVMGAAAFLIAEYVGITYAEVVKHAFLPTFLTYGALFYIVDIEAAKLRLRGLPRSSTAPPSSIPAARAVDAVRHHHPVAPVVYWGIGWTKTGVRRCRDLDSRRHAAGSLCCTDPLQGQASRSADRRSFKGHRQGAGFLRHRTHRAAFPYCLSSFLIWCLMVEEMSPGLSAFWEHPCSLFFIMVTQRPRW